DHRSHVLNSATFLLVTTLMSGINMYALAIVCQQMLGWNFNFSVLFSAGVVVTYTFLGGLSSSIYNEVLQFFLIIFGFLPLTVLGLLDVGGWDGLTAKLPALMDRYYPHGMLGLGFTALMASFMSGMAGNVTAFNTVWTYDLYQSYIVRDRDDRHYLKVGRIATIAGTALSVGSAYILLAFDNLMDYMQLLGAMFIAP